MLDCCFPSVSRCCHNSLLPPLLPRGEPAAVLHRSQPRSREASTLPQCGATYRHDSEATQQDSGGLLTTERLLCNFYFKLNVPLINAETLKWHETSLNKFEDTIPFLANVPDIPNFPVVWIDLGADVESVRKQLQLQNGDSIDNNKFSGSRPGGQTHIRVGEAGSDP